MENTSAGNAWTDESVSGRHTAEVSTLYLEHRAMLLFQIVFIAVSSALTISGNVLIISLILLRPSLRKRDNIFLANLAITDVLFGLVEMEMTRRIVHKYRHPEEGEIYPWSHAACDAEGVLFSSLMVAAIISMAAIAVDRYIRICRSQAYPTICNKAVVITVTLGIWAVAVVTSLPPVFMEVGIIYRHEFGHCVYDRDNIFQQMFAASVGFVLPCAVIVWAYTQIYRRVRASKAKVSSLSAGSQVSQRVLSRFIAFCTFMFLYMPYFLMSMLDLRMNFSTETKVYTAVWIYLARSLNPILHGIFNSHFRQEYWTLFLKCKRNNAVGNETGSAPTSVPVHTSVNVHTGVNVHT